MAKKTDTPEPYDQETITYSVAATSRQPAADVDLVLTYDPAQTAKEAKGGYYEIVGATGTYTELNANGSTSATYPINNLLQPETFYGNERRLYIDNPQVPTIVDKHGVSFEISVATQHNSNRVERINLSYIDKAYEQRSKYGASDVTSFTASQTKVQTEPASDTIAQNAVCFAAGTRILTTRGEVAVEELRVGDLAVTASGAARPIRWLGHRAIETRRHPRPHEVMPVRIAAHAFGTNKPSRDLRVSPAHALCLDILGEVLIPASALVDGAAIVQETVERVTYWHVELDSHDILLAENLAAESYLEMGNRGFFAEGGIVDLLAGPDGRLATTADFCRPYVADGPLLEAARRRLVTDAAPARPGRIRAA